MTGILIAHGDLLTVDAADTIIADGAIAVSDGRIAAVGPFSEVAPHYPDFEVLDARHMVVMPGFVNTHTHLAMTMIRSIADDIPNYRWLPVMWAVEAHLDDESLYAGSLLGVAEMIASGTTCFNDSYFVMRNTAKAVAQAGIRADLGEGFLENRNYEAGQRQLEAAKAFAAEWHGTANGRIRARLAPHALYTCSTELIVKSYEAAKELGIGWNMHVSESALEMKMVGSKARGETPVQHLEAVGVLGPELVIGHGLTINDRDIEILVERGAAVAHCPQAYGKGGTHPFPMVSHWIEAGLKASLGTDGTAGNNNLDMIDEMRFGTMAAKLLYRDSTLLPARQMIRLATIMGARALGLDHEIGSLEVGKRADIILLDFRRPHLFPYHNLPGHLVYSAGGADVDTVIVDGRILYQGKQFLTLDLDEVLDRAQAAFKALFERADWVTSLVAPQASLEAALKLKTAQDSLAVMEVLAGERDPSHEL